VEAQLQPAEAFSTHAPGMKAGSRRFFFRLAAQQ
jgi:hypothetical protein